MHNNPPPSRLPRRTVLRGAGGVGVALPLLEAMMGMTGRGRRAHAAGKQRFVAFYTPHGAYAPAWNPTGSENAFTLPYVLEPLKPLQSKLVVLKGINMESARDNKGNGHDVGALNLLTGRKFIFKDAGGGAGAHGYGADVTIDQVIAKRIGKGTRFESLQLGVKPSLYISFSGPKQHLPAEPDPKKAFDRLFAGGGAAPAAGGTVDNGAAASLDRTRSVLDLVREDARGLQARLSPGDRRTIDGHLTSIRELEQRLEVAVNTPAPSCAGAKAPDAAANSAYPELGKAQMDVLALALACDLTRVATLQWSSASGAGSRFAHTWLGQTQEHHSLSHAPNSDAAAVAKLKDIQNWYMKQLAYFAGALDKVKEGTGTALDNTMVFHCSEVAAGNSHGYVGMPFVLVGGAGAMKTGRFLDYTGKAHNDLYLSFLRAYGGADTTFGDPAYCTGPLAGLV